MTRARVEYTLIRAALIEAQGNTAVAGRSLQLSRQAVHRRVCAANEQHLIRPPRSAAAPSAEKIVAAFAAGGSLREVGTRLGVSKQAASRYAKLYAPSRPWAKRQPIPVPDAVEAEVRALAASQWSIRRTATALGLSWWKVMRILGSTPTGTGENKT
jgi:transcriptional regulator of acetoin/glycerol metabolism